jgi:tetratricopeptide (TPR) repeat protein
MKRRTAIGVAGILVLCWLSLQGAAAALRQSDRSQDRVAESLERYQRGDFDNAVSALIGSRQVRSIVGEFRSRAGAWIDRAPVADRHDRTLVVAAMGVEVVSASFLQHFFDYQSARELIEWSCGRLSKFPPVDAERWIHLAFIALAQGARDDSALTGVRIAIGGFLPATGPHAEHAGRRFPQEGRFRLAHVTAVWQAQMIATFPLPPAYLYKGTAGRFEIDIGDVALKETLRLLAALFEDRQVGAEARLRSGVLKFERDDPVAATEDLRQAVTGDDAAVRSLAHLMLGTIADRGDNSQEALRHFRLAYEAVPSSASSVALATRLFRSGKAEEATAVLRAFEAVPPGPDPWDLYGQRDFRFFGAYKAQVRRAVAK